jgi:hypothetical protein
MNTHELSPVVRGQASFEGFFTMQNAFRKRKPLSKNKGIRTCINEVTCPIHNGAAKLQRRRSLESRTR